MPKKEKTDQKNRKAAKAVAPRVVPTPEQIRENKRNEYIAGLDGMAAMAKTPYKTFQDIYGSSGKLPNGMKGAGRYNDVPVPVPNGVNDIFVTAVTLGAMMNPSRLDRNMTGSSFPLGSDSYVGFNQLFFLENIPKNDSRMGAFPQVMYIAREEAGQALRDMESGKDDTRAYQYLNDFVRYAARVVTSAESYNSGSMMKISEYEGNKAVIRMTAELLSTEPYKSHIEVPEYERMKIMAVANQARVREELYTQKPDLMKNPPAAGSPEREEAVAELMFKEYLIGTIAGDKDTNYVEHERILQSILDRHGIDASSREYHALFTTPQDVVATRVAINNNLDKNRTSDREVILSRPDGIETLRKLYMDSIKATQTFKDLVAAEGTDFQDKLIELDGTASRGFGTFSDVKTNGEAEYFNTLNQKEYNEANEAVSTWIAERLDLNARQNYLVPAYDAKSLTQNHQRVELLSEEFAENAKLMPGDDHVQTIRREMENLTNQARSMMKAEKASRENLLAYTNTIDRIRQNIDAFFREKGESSVQAQEPLYMNLRRLSRNLKWNKYGIMEPERKIERERILRENENIYVKQGPENINMMLQMRKEQFAEERRGTHEGRRILLNKAETATEKLAELIKSGRPLENETKQEAVGYLRDILAERVHAKVSDLLTRELIHYSERYAANIVEKLPEYKALTEKLTMTDLGQIAFHGRGDQLIKGYSAARLVEMFREERTLETKSESDRLAGEEAKWEAGKTERNKQKERDQYRRKAAQRKEDYTKPLELFHRYYGSKPNIHPSLRLHQEYNALRIEEIPEGLDENTITAIIIGSIMRKDRLEHPMTSSNFAVGTTTYLAFNRNFIIDNFLSEQPDAARQGNIPLALLEGRRDALQAIEEYKNGHPEKAKEMIKTFVDFASDGLVEANPPTSVHLISVGASSVQKTMVQLGAEMVGKPPFYVEGPQSEVRRILGAATKQSMAAMNRICETKYGILTQPKPAGSPERTKEIEDLLFDQYLMSTLAHTRKAKDTVGDTWEKQMLDKYGLDEDYDPNTYDDVETGMRGISVRQMMISRENLVMDHEVMMSTEEGLQELRRLYLPEIRKTKLYKDLIGAEGTKYEDLLQESDAATQGGLQSFSGVKLENVAKPINDKNRPNLEKGFKELESIVDEIAVKAARDMQDFKGYDKTSLAGNVEHLTYIRTLMNQKIMSDKNLPDPAKAIIGEMKKVVKNFVNYAKSLSKKKSPITITDMSIYEVYANDIEKLANGYTSTQEIPKDGVSRHVYLAIKRVAFMARVNSDLVTHPAKLKERKTDMQEAMGNRSQKRVNAYREKHPNADTGSADYRYATLSNEALKTLRNAALDTMTESEVGASDSGKIMIGRAKEAVRSLTTMISKGEDHIAAHQAEAKELLRDIFAERIKARFDQNNTPVQEGENSIPLLAVDIPEFKDATKTITVGTIGTFLFENQGDKLLGKYDMNHISGLLENQTNKKRREDLAKIEEIEKNRGKKEPKNVINEEPENENRINEEPENENRINEEPEKKIQDDSEKERQHQASEDALKAAEEDLTRNSAQDSEKALQEKSHPAAPVGRKKKKGVPKQAEEPKEEPKSEIKEEQPKKEPKDAPKEEAKDGFHKLLREYDQSKSGSRRENRSNLKNLINDLADMGNRIEENGPAAGEARPVEGMDKASAEAFMKWVYTFNRARNNLIRTIEQDIRTCRKDLVGAALMEAGNMLKCEGKHGADLKKVNTPQMMWDALDTLSLRMDTLNPEQAVKYKVMVAVLGEAIKPLTRLTADIPPLTSRNAANATLDEIFRAGDGINRAYGLHPMKKGEVGTAYQQLEDKAKAKMLLHNALRKATGFAINTAPANHDPDETIIEVDPPTNMHDAALRCVTKAFLVKAEKASGTAGEIKGLTAVAEGKGFEAEVKDLEKNPFFIKVASRHRNHYFSRWQKILNSAEAQKETSLLDLGHMSESAGPQGLAGYVAFGDKEAPLAVLGNAEKQQLLREVRLAKVLTAKLLSSPGFSTLRQAVGYGMIKPAEVAMEALDYIEKKNIRIVDELGRLDRNFARKLDAGDFQKDMIKSQMKFVAQARNRNPEHKKVLQSKLNTVKKPEPKALL